MGIEPKPEIDTKQAVIEELFGHHAASSYHMGPAGYKNYCADSKV